MRDPDSFTIKSLRDFVREHRSQLVHAALVLVRAWLANGKPQWTGITLGTFEQWSRVCGGIAQVAGLSGLLGNVMRPYEETETDEETVWAHLMERWASKFKDAPVAAADLIKFDHYSNVSDEGLVNKITASALG